MGSHTPTGFTFRANHLNPCLCKGACNCREVTQDSLGVQSNSLFSSQVSQLQLLPSTKSASDSQLYPPHIGSGKKSAFYRNHIYPNMSFTAKPKAKSISAPSSPSIRRISLVEEASCEQRKKLQKGLVPVIREDNYKH